MLLCRVTANCTLLHTEKTNTCKHCPGNNTRALSYAPQAIALPDQSDEGNVGTVFEGFVEVATGLRVKDEVRFVSGVVGRGVCAFVGAWR